MLSIKRILLPVDFSDRARAAVRYGTAIATRCQSSLILLHVLPAMSVALKCLGGGGTPVQEVLAHQKDDAERKLRSFMADEFRGFQVEGIVAEGDPALVIGDYARSEHVDLIVMSTRGCGVVRRFLLGSVTSRVLHDAPCPVLTAEHDAETRLDPKWELREILCAVNSGSTNEEAMRWAGEFASMMGAHVSVVHAASSLNPQSGSHGFEAHMADSSARIVRAVAQDRSADLVVIGPGSGTGNRYSYAIINESPCPVVSV